MNVDFPGVQKEKKMRTSTLDIDEDVQRIDLDDLGGEICLLDWGVTKYSTPALSVPNRNIEAQSTMKGEIDVYLLSENLRFQPKYLYQRKTKLNNNHFITALK